MEKKYKTFYHNYLFTESDRDRTLDDKPWWEWPWWWILPTYAQIGIDGYAYFYKQWGNRYYLVGYESIHA